MYFDTVPAIAAIACFQEHSEVQPHMRYPVCLTYECVSLLQDCGAMYSYADLLDIIAALSHENRSDRA